MKMTRSGVSQPTTLSLITVDSVSMVGSPYRKLESESPYHIVSEVTYASDIIVCDIQESGPFGQVRGYDMDHCGGRYVLGYVKGIIVEIARDAVFPANGVDLEAKIDLNRVFCLTVCVNFKEFQTQIHSNNITHQFYDIHLEWRQHRDICTRRGCSDIHSRTFKLSKSRCSQCRESKEAFHGGS